MDNYQQSWLSDRYISHLFVTEHGGAPLACNPGDQKDALPRIQDSRESMLE